MVEIRETETVSRWLKALRDVQAKARIAARISRAAEALGLERSHLYRKMKTLGIHLGE